MVCISAYLALKIKKESKPKSFGDKNLHCVNKSNGDFVIGLPVSILLILARVDNLRIDLVRFAYDRQQRVEIMPFLRG